MYIMNIWLKGAKLPIYVERVAAFSLVSGGLQIEFDDGTQTGWAEGQWRQYTAKEKVVKPEVVAKPQVEKPDVK